MIRLTSERRWASFDESRDSQEQNAALQEMRASTFTHEEKKVSDLWQDYCCTRKQNSEQQHESINNHVLETKSACKLVPSQYPWPAFFLLSWTSPFFFAWFYQWLQSICFNISSASLDRSSHRQRSSGAFNRTYISHTQVAPSLAPAHNLHALIRPKYVPFGAYLVSNPQSSSMLHAFPFLTLRTGYFHIANGMHVINMTQH